MAQHHDELHLQHKHEMERPNEVFRADTKLLTRALDAMERTYKSDDRNQGKA